MKMGKTQSYMHSSATSKLKRKIGRKGRDGGPQCISKKVCDSSGVPLPRILLTQSHHSFASQWNSSSTGNRRVSVELHAANWSKNRFMSEQAARSTFESRTPLGQIRANEVVSMFPCSSHVIAPVAVITKMALFLPRRRGAKPEYDLETNS